VDLPQVVDQDLGDGVLTMTTGPGQEGASESASTEREYVGAVVSWLWSIAKTMHLRTACTCVWMTLANRVIPGDVKAGRQLLRCQGCYTGSGAAAKAALHDKIPPAWRIADQEVPGSTVSWYAKAAATVSAQAPRLPAAALAPWSVRLCFLLWPQSLPALS